MTEKNDLASLAAEHGYRTRKLEDGEIVIACARGFLCEWEPSVRLAWCVTWPAASSPSAKLKNAAKKDPKLRLDVEGDEEFIASFAIVDLAWVAQRWAKVRKRRQLSPERRAVEAERLRAFRFVPAPRSGTPNEPSPASEALAEAGSTGPRPQRETASGSPVSDRRSA